MTKTCQDAVTLGLREIFLLSRLPSRHAAKAPGTEMRVLQVLCLRTPDCTKSQCVSAPIRIA